MSAVSPLGLRFEHVSHGYDIGGSHLAVLDDVSLDIAPGEFVALLGPSGCGKSTLLRLAAGLELPGAGRAEGDGAAISGPGPDRILVFQEATLFPWRTVRRNVEAGPEARGELAGKGARVDEALRLVGLESFGDAYPHQLSGGMAQRAAIARALVNDPPILLADEPTGALDSKTGEEILTLFKRLRDDGHTVILITHDAHVAAHADRTFVMHDGQLHGQTTAEAA